MQYGRKHLERMKKKWQTLGIIRGSKKCSHHVNLFTDYKKHVERKHEFTKASTSS